MSQAAMRLSDQFPHLFPRDYAALCEPLLRGILERCESDQFETLWHAGNLTPEEAMIVACLIAEQDMLGMPGVQLVDRLLGAGAEVNALDNFDRTPLHAAALTGCGDTFERLLTAGGDPSLRDLEGSTPADLARHKGHEGLASTLQGGREPEVSFQLG